MLKSQPGLKILYNRHIKTAWQSGLRISAMAKILHVISTLDSSFLVFKNLFLSFALFIIAFFSSFVIKLQLFERIYFMFLERACQEKTLPQCH